MNLNCFTDCKGVAVSAIGHPGVELELLLQDVVSSFILQVPNLSRDYSCFSEQSLVDVLINNTS